MKTTLILLSLALGLSAHAQKIRPMSVSALQTARHLLTPAAIVKGDFLRDDRLQVHYSLRRSDKQAENTLISVFWPREEAGTFGSGFVFIENSQAAVATHVETGKAQCDCAELEEPKLESNEKRLDRDTDEIVQVLLTKEIDKCLKFLGMRKNARTLTALRKEAVNDLDRYYLSFESPDEFHGKRIASIRVERSFQAGSGPGGQITGFWNYKADCFQTK